MNYGHRGSHLSAWISTEKMEKVKGLAVAAGVSKTEVIRALIDERTLPEKSYWKACNRLASIGGLIMAKVKSGKYGNAYMLGKEVLDIAKQLKEGCHGNDSIGDQN